MKNFDFKLFFLALVTAITMALFSSCNSEVTVSTKSAMSDVELDTTSMNIINIHHVDDDLGIAYGTQQAKANAEVITYNVVVPYKCLKYDSVSQEYYLINHLFEKALLDDNDTLSSFTIENYQLVGQPKSTSL